MVELLRQSSGISSLVNGVGVSPMNFASNIHVRGPSYPIPGNQDQGLTDPVQLMRMLSGTMPNQLNTANPQVSLPFTSSRKDEPNATTTTARAWMSVRTSELKTVGVRAPPEIKIAAASLFNPTRELPNAVLRPHANAPGSVGLQQSEKNRFSSQSLWQPVHTVPEELHLQNSRSNVFPQHAISTMH